MSDLGSLIEFKTSKDAQSVCEGIESCRFQVHLLLNFEHDPVTANTRGALTTMLVSMFKKTVDSLNRVDKKEDRHSD